MLGNEISTISYDHATSKHTVKHGEKSIETTVTDTATVADEWVQEIMNKYSGNAKVVVGLDLEWKPYANNVKPAILQLCVEDKCLILQLLYMEHFPTLLKSFFMDPKFNFVGVGIEEDISKIIDAYGLQFKNWEDVRDRATGYGNVGDRTGLKEVAMVVCNMDLKKPANVGMSDWESRNLSMEQVEYACMDSYASYCVGHKLLIG